jgi:hypothetical protein
MHVYHVKPVSNHQRWKIQEKDSETHVNAFDDQVKAIEYAIEFAQENLPAQVVVHDDDGSVKVEYTYG